MSLPLGRDLFPVTQKFAFLNNAAESPLNTATHARIQEYLATALAAPHTRPAAVRAEVRELLAELLGRRSEDFAMMSGTCQGINAVAAGIEWKDGDNVVLTRSTGAMCFRGSPSAKGASRCASCRWRATARSRPRASRRSWTTARAS